MADSSTPEQGTVDLAELTDRLALPAHQQEAVYSFTGHTGPWEDARWTEEEAAAIVYAWSFTLADQ